MTAANLAAFCLAISLWATALGSAAHLEQNIWRGIHWRAVLLRDPTAARTTICRQTSGNSCRLKLLLKQDRRWQAACAFPPKRPEPPRYYRITVECQIWRGLPRRRLLDLVFFR